MLNRLKIKNFQSHRRSELTFSPGVNVIVGTSDSGKSAILRALRWLIWNRPSGDAFRSWWGGDIEVELETSENTIRRRKGKTDEYVLDEGEPFRAFRTDVPQEITDAVNISEVNFQQQSERYFLLNSTPGEVARFFNKVAHLDQIDRGSSFIRSTISRLTSTIDSLRIQRKAKKEELDTYDYLEKFEMELEVLETTQENYDLQIKSIAKLRGLIADIFEVDEEINSKCDKIALEPFVDILLTLYAKRQEIEDQAVKIEDLLSSLTRISEKQEEYQHLIDLETYVDNILSLVSERDDIKQQWGTLEKGIKNIEFIDKALKENQKDLISAEKKFNDNFPDICPLCDSPIKNHKHGTGSN